MEVQLFNRLVILVTLLAFLMNMTGCAYRKSVSFSQGEIAQNPRTKVETVQLYSGKRRVGLKNGDIIIVQSKGARLEKVEGKISRLIVLDTVGQELVFDIYDLKSTPEEIFRGSVLFDNYGGRIDLQNQIIYGMRSDSTKVKIPFSEVGLVTGKTLDKEINILGSLVTGALVFVVVMFWAISQSDEIFSGPY